MGADEAAAGPQVAVDALVLDETLDVVEPGITLVHDGMGSGLAVAPGQFVEIGFDPGADLAAVARAAAPCRVLGVEDMDAAAGAGQHDGRGEAGVAGADDGDVDLVGHRLVGNLRARGLVPPVGRELHVVGKEGMAQGSGSRWLAAVSADDAQV